MAFEIFYGALLSCFCEQLGVGARLYVSGCMLARLGQHLRLHRRLLLATCDQPQPNPHLRPSQGREQVLLQYSIRNKLMSLENN